MSSPESESRARRMWRALEPVHAVTYFAPEAREAAEDLGLRGFWRGYFGQRAAPLGAVPAEIVTALFYNFAPGFVARSVPQIWSVAPPERLLEARVAAVDRALRRSLDVDVPEVAEAADLARAAAESVSTAGRALAAANAALRFPRPGDSVADQPPAWPTEPHLVLWHAQTILREQRGDGHVAALVGADLDPCEALVVFAAAQGMDAETLRERRGWTPDEWAAARDRLARRGLVGESELTPDGWALHSDVEARTDALADRAWQALGDARCERLVELVGPLVSRIIAAGDFMEGNPMGMRPLVSG
jgi:hypothetical protein